MVAIEFTWGMMCEEGKGPVSGWCCKTPPLSVMVVHSHLGPKCKWTSSYIALEDSKHFKQHILFTLSCPFTRTLLHKSTFYLIFILQWTNQGVTWGSYLDVQTGARDQTISLLISRWPALSPELQQLWLLQNHISSHSSLQCWTITRSMTHGDNI